MGVISVTKCLHIILASTVFLFNIIEHEVASIHPSQFHSEAPARSSSVVHFPQSTPDVPQSALHVPQSASNGKYIEIDPDLVYREIAKINEMTPLPMPDGEEIIPMKKFPVTKRQIQDIILEIDIKKESNKVNSFQPSSTGESGSWKDENEIRKAKLKSVLGTDGEVYYDADWGLMSAVLTCYNNHWVLKTGPEDWWTVVIRKIVQAMDEHGDIPQVRDFFVEHEGKKRLEVNVGPTLSHTNYNWLFSQFENNIRANLKNPSYVDIINNDFSSSTGEQKMVSQIMLMSSLKRYFEFGLTNICGIPGVEMKGTLEDWKKLDVKIYRLQSLLAPIMTPLKLTDWFKIAKNVTQNLVNTYKGKPDIEWWEHILTWNVRFGSGDSSYWSGWFPKFFGSLSIPNHWVNFPSDLVTVPLHISDFHNQPPVEDDAILVAGIVGFNVEEGVRGRAPTVEPKHAWSLLLPEDSPVADRLTGKWQPTNIGPDTTRQDDDIHHGQPTNSGHDTTRQDDAIHHGQPTNTGPDTTRQDDDIHHGQPTNAKPDTTIHNINDAIHHGNPTNTGPDTARHSNAFHQG